MGLYTWRLKLSLAAARENAAALTAASTHVDGSVAQRRQALTRQRALRGAGHPEPVLVRVRAASRPRRR